MPHGHFVWCDLSAYNAPRSRAFYERLMGWSFTHDGDYHIAHQGRTPVAGHFPMPAKFQDIGMPPFWMSYIAVEDIDKAVALATDLGGRVEIQPSDFATGGKYALIRDPLGAGFTVYQGPPLGGGENRGHGLFVSDATAVIPFYSGLFGWEFTPVSNGTHAIKSHGKTHGHLHEIPDPNVRGKEQYWALIFDHNDLEQAAQMVAENGGAKIAEFDLPEGHAMLMHDPDGAGFMMLEKSVTSAKPQRDTAPLWAWFGITLTVVLALSNMLWPWAIFFAVWVFTGLRSGQTYMFQPITRAAHPISYWALMGLYTVFGILCLPIWGMFG